MTDMLNEGIVSGELAATLGSSLKSDRSDWLGAALLPEGEKLPGGVLSHPQKSKAGGGIPAYRNVNQKVSGELTPKESNPR